MRPTFAYIDPAAGSLILQALVGGVAGAAVFFRARIRRMFGRGETTDVVSEQPVESEA